MFRCRRQSQSFGLVASQGAKGRYAPGASEGGSSNEAWYAVALTALRRSSAPPRAGTRRSVVGGAAIAARRCCRLSSAPSAARACARSPRATAASSCAREARAAPSASWLGMGIGSGLGLGPRSRVRVRVEARAMARARFRRSPRPRRPRRLDEATRRRGRRQKSARGQTRAASHPACSHRPHRPATTSCAHHAAGKAKRQRSREAAAVSFVRLAGAHISGTLTGSGALPSTLMS